MILAILWPSVQQCVAGNLQPLHGRYAGSGPGTTGRHNENDGRRFNERQRRIADVSMNKASE